MSPTPRHILLVEDEPTLQRILGSVLGDVGHEVEAVDSAEHAVQRLDEAVEGEIDLVLSDKNLPEMNGLDLLDLVRQQEAQAGWVRGFILVTGYPSRESALRVLDRGGDGYLVKPFRSLGDAATAVQRVLDAPLTLRRQAHELARRVAQAVQGAARLDGVEVSVLVDERPLRLRLEGHLKAAGAQLVPVEARSDAPRALVAARTGDLIAFRRDVPSAGLVLVDPTAIFDDLVALIDAGGGTYLEPTTVGAAP